MSYICLFLFLFLSFSGCSREKEGFLQEQAKAKLLSLLVELKAINSSQEATQRKEEIEKKFLDLVQVIIQLRENNQILPSIEGKNGNSLSVQKEILVELERLYQIDGCPEIMELAEEAALEKLDRYEYEIDLKLKRKEGILIPK